MQHARVLTILCHIAALELFVVSNGLKVKSIRVLCKVAYANCP